MLSFYIVIAPQNLTKHINFEDKPIIVTNEWITCVDPRSVYPVSRGSSDTGALYL